MSQNMIEDWERNDRITRAAEWVEFGARCLIVPFCGSAMEYLVSCLKQDYRRLREGRATYWYRK